MSAWIERLRGRRRLRLRHPLAIESDEIDRVEQERREAAVADRGRDDFARKWKKKTRALDQDDRLHAVGRYVLDAEDAAKNELEAEQQRSLRLRPAFQPEQNL